MFFFLLNLLSQTSFLTISSVHFHAFFSLRVSHLSKCSYLASYLIFRFSFLIVYFLSLPSVIAKELLYGIWVSYHSVPVVPRFVSRRQDSFSSISFRYYTSYRGLCWFLSSSAHKSVTAHNRAGATPRTRINCFEHLMRSLFGDLAWSSLLLQLLSKSVQQASRSWSKRSLGNIVATRRMSKTEAHEWKYIVRWRDKPKSSPTTVQSQDRVTCDFSPYPSNTVGQDNDIGRTVFSHGIPAGFQKCSVAIYAPLFSPKVLLRRYWCQRITVSTDEFFWFFEVATCEFTYQSLIFKSRKCIYTQQHV